jgi:hypothetical protein
MANNITSLLRDAYAALEIVSREPTGILKCVTRDITADSASKGTTVRNPVAPKNAKYTITPSMTPLAAADMTYTNRTISLDTLEGYKFSFASEEQMGLKASGSFMTLWQQNIQQGFRTLSSSMSSALLALYYNAARAIGTPGTTPFGSDLSLLSAANQELARNGAPVGNRHVVLDHLASYNLGKLTQLSNVNQAGSDKTLRTGDFDPLFGFSLYTDSNVKKHTVGTSTGQDCTAVEPIGETSIAYDGGDAGTILVGDTIAPAADVTNLAGAASKYVVNTAVTAASGNIVINGPGLLQATSINDELALGSTAYRANLALSSDALVLAARAPQGGDAAVEEMFVDDPISGLRFRLARYAGHHISNWEMSIIFGVGLGNPEHMVIIQG